MRKRPIVRNVHVCLPLLCLQLWSSDQLLFCFLPRASFDNKMAIGSVWQQVTTLVRRNARLKHRNKTHTIQECFWPLYYYGVLVALSFSLPTVVHPEILSFDEKPLSVPIRNTALGFAPNSSAVIALVNASQAFFPPGTSVWPIGFASAAEVELYALGQYEQRLEGGVDVAGLVFADPTLATAEYTIRMRTAPDSASLYSSSEGCRPTSQYGLCSTNGYFWGRFMVVEQAINSALLQAQGSEIPSYDIRARQLPKPRHEAVSVIMQLLLVIFTVMAFSPLSQSIVVSIVQVAVLWCMQRMQHSATPSDVTQHTTTREYGTMQCWSAQTNQQMACNTTQRCATQQQHNTAPHHTAPHHTTPHHTTPHHTTPHHTTPHHTTPHHTTLHHTTSHHTTPHHTTPHHTTPHHTTPHRTAPHRTAPHRTAPHHTTPHHTTPHHTTLHRTIPHHTTPHHTTPHHTTPHHTTPHHTTPHHTTPHHTTPHHTTPRHHTTTPHHTTPMAAKRRVLH